MISIITKLQKSHQAQNTNSLDRAHCEEPTII